eukprot:1946114-Amphidinium_carterae.2
MPLIVRTIRVMRLEGECEECRCNCIDASPNKCGSTGAIAIRTIGMHSDASKASHSSRSHDSRLLKNRLHSKRVL